MIPIIDKPEAFYEYITNNDSITYILTSKNASNFRLVAIDLKNPKEVSFNLHLSHFLLNFYFYQNNYQPFKENWVDIIGEHSKNILQSVIAINETYLVAAYLRDVKSVLELRRLSDGHYYKDIKLPIGTIQRLSGRRNDNIMFFSVTSFLIPSIIYSYDFYSETDEIKVKIIFSIH
jgi:prolyl oligopeptidase